MAHYRVLATPSTAVGVVKEINDALTANATSVEITVDEHGRWQIVAWFGQHVDWTQHQKI
jgi:hypothetical protein